MTQHPRHGVRRTLLRTAGAAIALTAAAGGAPPAQADSLSSGRAVTPAGTEIDGYAIAGSPAGGRVALLYGARSGGGDQRLLFARLGLGRNLGPARRIEVRRSASRLVTTFGGQVAVGSDGSAIVAWVAIDRGSTHARLRVAIAPAGAGFGRARTIARTTSPRGSVPYMAATNVVAGSHGRFVVTFTRGKPGSTTIQAMVRNRGGSFGAAQKLGGFGPAVGTPSLVLAPSGTVLATWLRRAPAHQLASAATLLPRSRRFGKTRLVSGGDHVEQLTAGSGPGGAAVSWSDDRRTAGTMIALRIARLRRDGTLGAAHTIALVDPGIQAHEVDGLTLGFPLAGPAAAWQVFNDISEGGDGHKDQTHIDLSFSGDGAFSLPELRSTPGAPTGLPVVGALDDRVLVAWSERTGTPAGWHLRLAEHRSGGGWGPVRTFADIDGSIAIAAGRRSALVLWQPFARTAVARVLRLAVYRP